MKLLCVIYTHKNHPVGGQKVARQDQAAVHVLQPFRVPVQVVLIHKAVVVDEVLVSGVVRRIDIDALDLAAMRHAQVAQGIKIVALDQEVFVRSVAVGQVGIQVQRHKISVDGVVVVDLIALPHQAKARLAVPLPQ